MNRQFPYRIVLVSSVLLLLLTSASCANLPGAIPTEATSTPVAAAAATPTVEISEPTPTAEAAVDDNVVYHDDFTNPATGWTEEKFDNYFVGYHEPEYYHIEITSPNYKTPIFAPEKQ